MKDIKFEGLRDIGQIAVTVKDLDRAIEFYRDKMQVDLLFQVPGMAFFDCGGVRLMLSRPEGADSGNGNSIIYFRVADINATTANLKDNGVVFKSEPHLVAEMRDHNLWMAFFGDSEGNTMALMCEIRR